MFYKINNREISEFFQNVHKIFKSVTQKILSFQGAQIKSKETATGELIHVDTGIPAKIFVFKGQNSRHNIKIDLDIECLDKTNLGGKNKKYISIRGMTIIDRAGKINTFFFDPREDGIKEGYLKAKIDAINGVSLTEDEIDEAVKRNIIDIEQAEEIRDVN